jgi:DNA-binding transcriptional LysR family regulator
MPPGHYRKLGQDYADRARRILADIQEAGEAMASHIATPRGTIKVTAQI